MFPGNGNAGGAGGGNWNQGSPPSGSGMYDKSLPFPDAFGFKGSMQQQQSGGVSVPNFFQERPGMSPFQNQPYNGPGSSMMMNSMANSHNLPGLGHMNMPGLGVELPSPKVRVKCESCGVLLEVNVPQQHPAPSMIVRCGNCSSLLEVQLSRSSQPQAMPQMLSSPMMYPGMSNPQFAGGGGMYGMQGPPFQHPHMGGQHHQPPPHLGNHQQFPNFAGAGNIPGGAYGGGQGAKQRGKGGASMQQKGRPKKTAVRAKKPKEEAKPKKLSVYNQFVAQEVDRLRKCNPGTCNKMLFKMAATSWKTSPLNKKRVKLEEPQPSSSPAPAEDKDTQDVQNSVLPLLTLQLCILEGTDDSCENDHLKLQIDLGPEGDQNGEGSIPKQEMAVAS